MPVHDFKAQRLYCDTDLAADLDVVCTRDQTHYLVNVLRLGLGDQILVFNGRDGEWRAHLSGMSKRTCSLTIDCQIRTQTGGPDVTYLFAPLKRARLDYMVQKATEMGVACLQPVLTRHTIADRVNLERMRANVIEAAEQCGVLRLPDVREPRKLAAVLADWQPDRVLIFADEDAEIESPVHALERVAPGPLAVLIGPEGGFSVPERDFLLSKPFTRRLSLGPRIMRADTAAIAVLALVNATLGDWKVP